MDGLIVFASYANVLSHQAQWCNLTIINMNIWTCASIGPHVSTTQTANRSVQPFLHRSWVSLYFTKGPSLPSLKITRSHRVSEPHLTRFLGPIGTRKPNGIFIDTAVFAQMTAVFLYVANLQWYALPQNCPFPWGSGPHLINGSLGPSNFSTHANSISIGSAVFAGLSCDRQTDRQTTLLGQ